MSGFEHYPEELQEIQHEINLHASICGVDLQDSVQVAACVNDSSALGARETLRGLLILRIKVETQMLEQGFAIPTDSIKTMLD